MLRDEALRRIPVLAASTNPGLAEQVAATYQPLVRDLLPKPFDFDEFFATLRRLKVPISVP